MVAAHDIALPISLPVLKVAVNIPFTGPLRLFASCAGMWLVIWQTSYWLNRWLKGDFLRKIGLHNDLMYAYRPPYCMRIAIFMAKAALWVLGIKIVLGFLLQLAVNLLIPYLSTFLSQIPADILPLVTDILTQGLNGVLGLNSTWSVSLFVLSVLVIIANRAFEWEQGNQHQLDIEHIQDERRRSQQDIVIPATQQ
jgi:hypothetical protein